MTTVLVARRRNQVVWIACFILLLALCTSLILAYPPLSSEFYGTVNINLSGAPAGTVVTAFDPGGLLCGTFTVQNMGYFGLLSCLGDDVATGIDEGALTGDTITFFIDDQPTRYFYNYTWISGGFRYVDIDVNYPPQLIVANILNSTEDVLYHYDINATDSNNDGYTFASNATFFSVDSLTGIISFVPTNWDVGVHSININVTDDFGLYTDKNITFIVINVNDRPFFDHDLENQTAYSRFVFTYDINASDIDFFDTLTYFDNTTLFNISPTTGFINFTPHDAQIGNYSINISVCDDSGSWDNCTSDALHLEVYFSNHPPVLQPIESQVMYAGLPFTLQLNATDEDENDTLSYFTNATFFSIDANTGFVSFTPTDDDVGRYTILLGVTDNFTAVSQSVEFIVLPELYCGDGMCSSLISETCYSCAQDCGECPSGSTSDQAGYEAGAAGGEAGSSYESTAQGEETGTGAGQVGLDASSVSGDVGLQSDRQKPIQCYQNWTCSEWGPCVAGFQTRTCIDENNCTEREASLKKRGTPFETIFTPKPEEIRTCEMLESCNDGIQNQGEEGIDCGGPCEPCLFASITKYAGFPFIERPAQGCGDTICSLGEECACMPDCRAFPWKFLITFFLIFSGIAVVFLLGNFVLYKAGLYKKGTYFLAMRRISLAYAFLLFVLVVFTLFLYLYGSCPYITVRLIWLPVLVILLLPLVTFEILVRLGYLDARRRRMLKHFFLRHDEALDRLMILEESFMIKLEQEISLLIVSLYQERKEVMRAYPAFIKLYNHIIRLVKHRELGSPLGAFQKELAALLRRLLEDKSLEERSARDGHLLKLRNLMSDLFKQLSEKDRLQTSARTENRVETAEAKDHIKPTKKDSP